MNSKIFISLCFALLSAASVAGGTQVLGIPFGEKLPYSPANCPFNTDKATKICWIDTPMRYRNGDRTGYVHVPGADSRPLWAAHPSFKLSLTKDQTITQITVYTDGMESSEIAHSISTRFGLPVSSNQYGKNWKHKEANIEMLCKLDKCWTTFSLPPTDAELAEAAQRLKQQKPRPISP